jgi:hypothetical protein
MKPIMLFVLFVGVLTLAACDETVSKPVSGVVTSAALTKDSAAPDMIFVSTEGKPTTFKKISKPVAILAFIESPGEACGRFVPELIATADRFKGQPITVAQISLPTSKCSHGSGCTAVSNIGNGHLISLCDAKRAAWKAYGQPEPDTIILINDNNKIEATGTLENLLRLAKKAQILADNYELKENAVQNSQ